MEVQGKREREVLDFLLFQTKVLKNQKKRLIQEGVTEPLFLISKNYEYEIQKLKEFVKSLYSSGIDLAEEEEWILQLERLIPENDQDNTIEHTNLVFLRIDDWATHLRKRLNLRDHKRAQKTKPNQNEHR